MAQSTHNIFSAELVGDFVVFLIGMHVRRPWKLHKVFWMQRAMGRMTRELRADSAIGMLHVESFGGIADFLMVQYRRSFAHLERYANDDALGHAPAWRAFAKRIGYDGDIGILHETYAVENQRYETLYGAMPRFGRARAGHRVELNAGNRTAARCLAATPGSRADSPGS